MLAGFYKSKSVLAAETIALIIFPLILLKFFPDWLIYRNWVMLGGLVYVTLFAWSQQLSWKQLGFQLTNFKRAMMVLIRPTLITMFFIALLYLFFPVDFVFPLGVAGVGISPVSVSVFRYSLVSVPFQEILFRSYLINRAGLVISNQLFIRIYATIIFMLIHIPFKTLPLTLGSLFLGWIWVGNFLKFRNIYSVMLSHALVGLTYVLLMFIFKP